jgi:hypothetical protein
MWDGESGLVKKKPKKFMNGAERIAKYLIWKSGKEFLSKYVNESQEIDLLNLRAQRWKWFPKTIFKHSLGTILFQWVF